MIVGDRGESSATAAVEEDGDGVESSSGESFVVVKDEEGERKEQWWLGA